jgi:hypothetical protein
MNTQRKSKKIKGNEVSKTGIATVYPAPTRDKGKTKGPDPPILLKQ